MPPTRDELVKLQEDVARIRKCEREGHEWVNGKRLGYEDERVCYRCGKWEDR